MFQCDYCGNAFKEENQLAQFIYRGKTLFFCFYSKSCRDLYAVETLTDLIQSLESDELESASRDALKTLNRKLGNLLDGKFVLPEEEKEKGR